VEPEKADLEKPDMAKLDLEKVKPVLEKQSLLPPLSLEQAKALELVKEKADTGQ